MQGRVAWVPESGRWGFRVGSLSSLSLEACFAVADVERSEQHGAVEQLPGIFVDGLNPDGLASQSGGEGVDTEEGDASAAIDAPHFHSLRVSGGTELVGKGSVRRCVPRGWRSLTKSFVRAVVVVSGAEAVEEPLLLEHRVARRIGGLLLERAVHPLVPTILLRLSRLDALGRDAELDPPHRQSR